MKFATKIVALAFAAVSVPAVSAKADSGPRTITRVVKLLQEMMDKSKADGDAERKVYGLQKCQCDTEEKRLNGNIADYNKQIPMLESNIEGLKGSSGVLSSEVGQLRADMTTNEEARAEAEGIRSKENAAFVAMEADSVAAIGSMEQAISTLAEIGADQTMGAAADHKQAMADFGGASLVKLRATVKQALIASSAIIGKAQANKVDSFLQAPFTGAYSAVSGEVVGILKDMRDTFKSNLADAQASEKAAVEAHTKFIKNKEDEHAKMTASFNEKQEALSANDAALASDMEELKIAREGLAADEEMLASMLETCAVGAKDYNKRADLRRNEEVALSQCIAILNSDAAFETFSKSDATKTGDTSAPASFLQIHKHVATNVRTNDARRSQAQQMLRKAATGKHSFVLSKVIALLAANNPFAVVLKEITKMVELIDKEEKADQAQLAWCTGERETNNANLDTKKNNIIDLEAAITDLDVVIDNPEDGLKFTISETEKSVEANRQAQIETTTTRKEATVVYNTDISHLTQAQKLLENAIEVLDKYYAKIIKDEEGGFLQKSKEEPAEGEGAPDFAKADDYEGQSGKGNEAITMLKYIRDNAKAEENDAHEAEQTAQADYESEMTEFKVQEQEKQDALVELRSVLAEKEQELLEKKADLKATTEEKVKIEAYLEKIKPGCDFITANIETRTGSREEETTALEKAQELLKATPAFAKFEAVAHNETFGDCLGKCSGAEENVVCKACMADVTEPAYCAGHPGTEGC
jgi:hypothetical protein